MKKAIYSAIIAIALFSCSQEQRPALTISNPVKQDKNYLVLASDTTIKKVFGQLIYLPVYTQVPYSKNNLSYSLNAMVSIHNTDMEHNIKITKIDYYNNDGMFVTDFLGADTILKPMATINLSVPENTTNGIGTNLLIEWISEYRVNEPLIESIMVGLAYGQGISFISQGKIIREKHID